MEISLEEDLLTSALSAHNEYRARHGAPPLKWSNKLQQNAQKWAEEIARRGRMQHAELKEEGENLAAKKGENEVAVFADNISC